MKLRITCTQCESHLATIDRRNFTSEDLDEYRQMYTCECQADPELLAFNLDTTPDPKE